MRELYGRIWTDGYSPTIDVEYDTGVVTITVTDVNGTTSYEINLSESSISDRSIGHEKLKLETITADELADGAVTADKIGSGAVTEGKIGSGAVTGNKIGTGAVSETKIGAGAVTENKIGTGAVTRNKIDNGAVNADKLDVDAGDIPYSNTVSGLSATDVQEAIDEEKTAIDSKAVRATYSGTLSALSWSDTSGDAPYTQSVSIVGILATDNPHIALVYSSSNATAITEKEEWSKICKAESAAGAITFTCFEDPPEVNINFMVEVVR